MRSLTPLLLISISLAAGCGGGKSDRAEMVDLCLASCQRGDEVAQCGEEAFRECEGGCGFFRDEAPEECLQLGIDYSNCLLDQDVDWMCTEEGQLAPDLGPCEELGTDFGECVFSNAF